MSSQTLFDSYYELTKPKVVGLIVFTAVVGMILATESDVQWLAALFGTLGIGLAAASAAVINHVVDRRIDEKMHRTHRRPLPTGQLPARNALLFAFVLGSISMVMLVWLVNPLTAVLTFASLIGYAVIYTMYLKHATPQNIVIGGAAGAAPPVLGWAAITNSVDANALLLFLIIFAWTPPHFWALAIARKEDYANAGVPMLPVTHGVKFTSLQILLYTVIMIIITIFPYLTGMSSVVYLVGVLALDAVFLYYAWKMQTDHGYELSMKTFVYSINYLMLLFGLLLVDHLGSLWLASRAGG
ncbi:MAG: heme o synthase [Gammaproteobacteria bacterium]